MRRIKSNKNKQSIIMAKKTLNQPAAENTATVSKYEDFFLKNQKVIIGILVAVILIIAGIILYNNFVAKPRQEKASTQLAKMQQLFEQQQYEQALKGNGAAAPGLTQIASDYSGTDAGNLANYFAGIAYAKTGKWQEAAKYLEKFKTKKDLFVSPLSQMALGDCYANLKQFDKAIDAFKKAATMADKAAANGTNNTVSPTALKKAAIILIDQKQKAEAKKLFEEIKQKYINSPVAADIDKYIELVSE